MKKVTIYTKPGCPYCVRAMMLLGDKKADVNEIIASYDPELRREMMEKSGRSTFPQIFIGEKHVGGCDDIYALDRAGKLDELLAS
jgi:glutaredoxin 3